MLAGFALRTVALTAAPPGFSQDEAVTAYDAYSLAQTGRDHLGHPFPIAVDGFGDLTPPLLDYAMAPAVGIFGLHVWVARATAALFVVAAIALVYLLAIELFARRAIALAAAWIIALSPWAVHTSRIAIPPAVVPAMVALTLWLLVRAANRGSARTLVAAAVVAGLTMCGYQTMKLYVPLVLVAFCAIYARQLWRIGGEGLAYAAGAFSVIAAPVLYLSLRDPAGRSRFDQISVFHSAHHGPAVLARHYLSYFSPDFLWHAGDGAPDHLPTGYGVALVTLAPFVVAGIAWLLWRVLRRQNGTADANRLRAPALLLLAAVVLYPAPGSVTVPSPHTFRAVHVIPLLAIVSACGIVAVIDVLRGWRPARAPLLGHGAAAALAAATVCATAVELGLRYHDEFGAYRTEAAPAYQYGMQQAIAYTREHEAGYDEIWITDVNEPYIYLLFFTAWPPDDVHRNLQVHRAPPASNQVTVFHQYRFESLPPGVDIASLPVLETIRDPGGGPAYRIRGGEPAGRRLLVISKR